MAIPSLSKFVSLLTGWLDLEDTAPAAPAANRVRLFRRRLAGRDLPAYLGASGLSRALQSSIALGKIGVWQPAGNSTTVPGLFGMIALTALGTATNRGITSTNALTRQKRLGYVSAAAINSFAGIRLGASQMTTGDGAGLGGFDVVLHFAITDAVLVANARTFVGVSNSNAAPTDVEPSTLTSCVGVGHGAADTNLRIYYGGSTAQTPIDLGAGFTNSLNIPYRLALSSPPNIANVINYEVTRLDTNATVSGTLTGGSAIIPQSNMLLTPIQIWRSTNSSVTAVALDIGALYVETDG